MKTFKIVLLIFSGFMAAACENDPNPYLNLPDSIILEAEESRVTFTVSSNVNWRMSVSDPWFKITPKSGKGETTVTVGVDRNTSGARRTSALEFTYSDGTTARVPVSQDAFEVGMRVDAPASVVVEKGKQLAISVESNTIDWVCKVTDGDWLRQSYVDTVSVAFDLDPSVVFSETTPAVLAFSSPSDPLFDYEVSIFPVDFVEFRVNAPPSVDVETTERVVINIESNIEDWVYTLTEGAWMSETSRTESGIEFRVIEDNLLDPRIKATLLFSSPSYANFRETVEIQSVSSQPPLAVVDKSNMRAFALDNDGIVYNDANSASEYLFDGLWMVNKEDYGTSNIDGISFGYKHWQLSTTTEQSASGHGDSFTIDAGQTVKLARFVTYHYYNYTQHDPLEYEIYAYTGTESEPQSDWSRWTLLGKVDVTDAYHIVGALPSGSYSEHIANGDTLKIPEAEAVPARYYRFRMLQNGYAYGKEDVDANWSGRTHWLTLSEITIYGYE